METELDLFKWKQYESEIILLTIRWYLKYSLSYRNLVEMMEERGLHMAHTTIMRWVHQFGPELDKRIRPFLKPTNDSYRTDETYIKVKGQWKYLYRAVDSNGNTIDFMLSENRDTSAARRFFKKTLTSPHNQSPRVITVDKNPAYPIAVQQLKDEKALNQETLLRQQKYLNNIIEQDHRFIKKVIKLMMGFKSFNTAEKTIAGIEVMHMIKKGQVECIHSYVLSAVQLINKMFGLTA
ncbi:IS6 family transposase [Paenibacillus filicis]|uniref:IS6 family transposase n=1 Tax=Paenibacillus gyeongsangnamensis TaxID=3388067 RepID=A0ABT4QJ96_9BACL|nr:IS6 family transposase [Paenibacillus filicis]MCZ8516920.1 IS6 family transposase [Paenibacillus filicis]